MRYIHIEDMADLATGAAILGTGGGGDPYRGRLMAELAIKEHGPVQVIDTEELGSDDLVIPLWNIGAPVVGMERIERGDEGVRALRALEDFLGQKAVALSPVEVGGSNSTMPIRVAALTGLPLVDCDGMGRAYPEVQMITPTLFGLRATPASLVDAAGNCIILQTIDNHQTERIARAVCVQMGGRAAMAGYAMSGQQLRQAMIPGTLSLAQRIGLSLRQARERHTDPIQAILDVTGGFRLFEGKIVDVNRRIAQGWARGHFDVLGLDETLRVEFQNEFLIARTLSGRLLGVVPDLIMSVESQTGEPITTETLHYGYRVTILGIPCNERWRSEAGIRLGGAGYFGYEIGYVPIEELYKGGKNG
jgi:hypothetical protein